MVAELQKQHEEQLSRLTQLAKDRETAWNKQKEEMEQHYAQLLSDLQSRTKVGDWWEEGLGTHSCRPVGS